MAKRRNDNAQLSKEDYDAVLAREEEDTSSIPSGGGGFNRASSDVIQKRRIVRVSNRFKRPTGAGTGATPGSKGISIRAPSAVSAASFGTAASAAAPSTNNPFAKTVLKPSSVENTTAKSNPFATLSFANKATPLSTSGTETQHQGKRMKPSAITAPTSINFTPSTTATTTATATITTAKQEAALPPLRNGAKENDAITMNENTKTVFSMLRMAQMEAKANPLSNYTEWLEAYSSKIRKTQNQDDVTDSATNHTVSVTTADTKKDEKENLPTSTSDTTAITNNEVKKNDSTNPFVTSSPPKPFTGFSFTPAPTSAVPTTEKTSGTSSTGFSFNPISSTVPAPVAPTTTITSTTESEPSSTTATNNNNETEGVIKQLGEDEEELFECKAKYRKFVKDEKKWKTYAPGTLRLLKSKSGATNKIVIRDSTLGKVLFNVGVFKGMKFIAPQKAKGTASIRFFAVQDESSGLEQFCLVVKDESADGLFENLKKLAL